MKFHLTFFILFVACNTTKVYKPTIADLEERQYIEVTLQQLMQHKELYHGQYIQTRGFFRSAFEECAIYYDMDVPMGDTTIKYRDYCGLWIEFNINDPYYRNLPDTLKNQFVTLKGYFDTTKTGHVGGCYRATLTNAYNLKAVKQD